MTAGYADMAAWMRGVEATLERLSQGNQVSNGVIVDDETGRVVSLHQLAFGMKTAKNNGRWDSGGNNGATWYAGGPDVRGVRVRSDKLIVILSAALDVTGYKAAMSMSCHVMPSAGHTGTTVGSDFNECVGINDPNGTPMGVMGQSSYWRVITGLTPGLYDVIASYNANNMAGDAWGGATARSVTVLPF